MKRARKWSLVVVLGTKIFLYKKSVSVRSQVFGEVHPFTGAHRIAQRKSQAGKKAFLIICTPKFESSPFWLPWCVPLRKHGKDAYCSFDEKLPQLDKTAPYIESTHWSRVTCGKHGSSHVRPSRRWNKQCESRQWTEIRNNVTRHWFMCKKLVITNRRFNSLLLLIRRDFVILRFHVLICRKRIRGEREQGHGASHV